MISAHELLKDSDMKNLLEKMILDKADYLKLLKQRRDRFLKSNAYEKELKDFAPEFRKMVSDIAGDGAEIQRVEKDLSSMNYALARSNGAEFNEQWELDYHHATRDVKIARVAAHFLRQDTFKKLIHCPFHTDRRPSFKVYEKTNTFHCFGCGAHGSPVDFVMRFQNCGFKEAVKILSYL